MFCPFLVFLCIIKAPEGAWIFDFSVYNTKLSGIGSVIQVSGAKVNVYHTYIELCSFSLPTDHSYLLLGYVNSDASTIDNIMLAHILGENTSSHSRTTLLNGGGCAVWQYSQNGGNYKLQTYGYVNGSHNFTGRLLAIQLT